MSDPMSSTPQPLLVSLAAIALAMFAAPAALAEDPALVIPPDSERLEWGPCPEFMPEGCAIAVLHGNPAEPNADVFFKVPGGSDIPSHWHHSAERMVLVSGELEVQYEGQEAATLQVNDYAYGPPELAHDARCVSDEECVLFIAFNGPVDAMPSGE
jgi:anti-sigma factor ChrR (cupin superfamily)